MGWYFKGYWLKELPQYWQNQLTEERDFFIKFQEHSSSWLGSHGCRRRKQLIMLDMCWGGGEAWVLVPISSAQPKVSAVGMLSPTFRVDLASSVKILWEHFHRHDQKYVFTEIPVHLGTYRLSCSDNRAAPCRKGRTFLLMSLVVSGPGGDQIYINSLFIY